MHMVSVRGTRFAGCACGYALLVAWSMASPLVAQFAWREVSPQFVAAFGYAGESGVVFDESRGCIVVVSPAADLEFGSCATWEWSGAWLRRPLAVAPSTRRYASTVYDSDRAEVLLFGGEQVVANAAVSLGDTWTYDGSVWRQRAPSVAPSPRNRSGIAYDRTRHRAVLFGGEAAGQASAETWEWDGSTWLLRPVVGPSARSQLSMAFDSQRHRVVLSGGLDPSSNAVVYDTWEWDGSSWLQRSAPWHPVALGAPMTYDPVLQRTLLLDSAGVFEWSGTAWQGRLMSQSGGFGLCFDPATARSLTVSGMGTGGDGLVHVRSDQGTAWADLSQSVQSPPQCGVAMEYSWRDGRTLLFGGARGCSSGGLEDLLWEWRGDGWTEVVTATRPPARSHHSMAYDVLRQRLVLFGGQLATNGVSGDTWEFDGSAWTQTVGPDPGPRRNAAMAYDLVRGVTLLFGGTSTVTFTELDDTWSWDGIAWRAAAGSGAGPSVRAGASMACDPVRAQMILHGGMGGILDDTWTWDGVHWSLRPTAHRPVFFLERMVCDLGLMRPLLVGSPLDATTQQVFTWDGRDWIEATGIRGGVIAEFGHQAEFGMAYDVSRNRAVIHGGRALSRSGTTWELGPLANSAGPGCAGSAGAPLLQLTAPVRIAGSTRFAVSGPAPAATTVTLMLGDDNVASIYGPLPLDLASLGLPGCTLHMNPELLVVAPASNGVATIELPVPNVPQFVGFEVFAQALCPDAAANAFGAVVSNALRMTVDH